MKFHSLRSSLTAFVLACGSAILLAACGGGGAGGNPNQGGPISINPSGDNVTIYAGMPFTFTLQGGRKPYALTSSQPGILPLPAIVDGHEVTVVANNPGVIDAGLQDEDDQQAKAVGHDSRLAAPRRIGWAGRRLVLSRRPAP